jgi:hypothetical protein
MSGNTQLGSTTFVSNGSTPTGITATAVFVTTNLPTGQNTISAQYAGDANYSSSTSSSMSVSIDADFGIAPANISVNATQGSSATNTLTITGKTGYNSTINFSSVSCTGLPLLSSCSFSPVSVTGSGTTVVSIQTKAATSAALVYPGFQNSWRSMSMVFAAIVLLGMPRRRHRSTRLLSVFALGLVLGLTGCGGGTGGGGGGGGSPGTPKGSYPITVTATTADQVVSHTVAFTLVVQ